jgi:hypothetical protein
MSAHSPLPWMLTEHKAVVSVTPVRRIVIVETASTKRQAADAELIVEAVNEHASLLAERDALRSALERQANNDWLYPNEFRNAARDALAQSKP